MTSTAESSGEVLANRDLFAIRLGIPESKLTDFVSTVAVFTGGATVTALGTYLAWLASLGPIGHVLAWLGVISTPAVVWPAAIGGVVLAGGVYGTKKILRFYSSFANLEGKRSFTSPLSDLAIAVADVVFLPLTILARADAKLHPLEIQHIKSQMEKWGYDIAFVDAYLQSALDEDINASMDRFTIILKEIRKGVRTKYLRDVCIGQMKKEVLQMGREIMEVDGIVDFREQILLDNYAKNL